MSLRYEDRWVWDFWVAHDGDDVHLFHLQAPRSLGDPELRHRNATIGHAVSTDLRTWTELPTALEAGPPGAFDDLATWTGSVMRRGRGWEMLYSGISRAEDGAVQRIGRATSEDLVAWERHGTVVEADARWYETLGPGVDEEHWRDPWLFRDPASGRFHILACARARTGPSDGRGVIGHAASDDLVTWEVGPPLSAPGDLRQLEVPQLVRLGGAWRVLFSATEHDHSAARLTRPGVAPEGGSHVLTGAARLGPFALERDAFLLGDAQGAGTPRASSSIAAPRGSRVAPVRRGGALRRRDRRPDGDRDRRRRLARRRGLRRAGRSAGRASNHMITPCGLRAAWQDGAHAHRSPHRRRRLPRPECGDPRRRPRGRQPLRRTSSSASATAGPGVLERNCVELTPRNTAGILHRGGTILGTSRTNPYKDDADGTAIVREAMERASASTR